MGPDNPLEIIYFVEGANGQRLPAATTANMLNSLDVQHAAIIMGYRIQGILAQREHSDFFQNSFSRKKSVGEKLYNIVFAINQKTIMVKDNDEVVI